MIFLSKKSIQVMYGALWLLLFGLSVLRYPVIISGRCPFQTTNWLACTTELGMSAKIGLVGLVVGVFVGLMVMGQRLWKNVDTNPVLNPGLRRILLSVSLLAVFVVPLGTSDWPYYFSAGRALSEGLNPYVDNWTMYIDYASPAVQSPLTGFSYGPVIARLFQGMYVLAQGSALGFLFLWKALMALTLWTVGWAVFKVARELSGSVIKVEKWVWLAQPLLVFEWVVNGHFDGLWLLCLVGAIWAAHKKQWWLVLPVLAVGVWIKFIPVLLVPFFALWWWQGLNSQTWKKSVGQALVGLGLAGVITVMSWAPYWTGPEVFDSLVVQAKWAVTSLFAAVYYSLKPVFQTLFAARGHLYLTSLVQGSLLLLFGYTIWPLIAKGWKIVLKKEVWSSVQYVQVMFIFLLAYLLLWQKSFWPWYGTWFIPLGLIVYLVKPQPVVWKLTAWLATVPLVHHIFLLGEGILLKRDAGSELWFYWVIVLGVLAYPLCLLWQWRKQKFGLYV